MCKYAIAEKERSDEQAIDLSQFREYLLVPDKFVSSEQNCPLRMKVEGNSQAQEINTTKYTIENRYLHHVQTYAKGFQEKLSIRTKKRFFGLIVPSGRIKKINYVKVDMNETTVSIYSEESGLSFVTVKNLG